MPNQELNYLDGHCEGKCEQCHEMFQVPNQEVITHPGSHDDCTIGYWHHHHDRSPTLCFDCRGPDAETYLEREPKKDKDAQHNVMRRSLQQLVMTHKLTKAPAGAPEELEPEGEDQVDSVPEELPDEASIPTPEPAPLVGRRYVLVNIRLQAIRDIDDSLKELIKDLCANETKLYEQKMPCGTPLPMLSAIIERIWKKKDWPCSCGNPRHFFVKFVNL